MYFSAKEKKNLFEEGKEKESYSKPYFLAICVKYIEKLEKIESKRQELLNDFFEEEQVIQEEKTEKIHYATFRISKTTNFKDLKNHVGDFWVI